MRLKLLFKAQGPQHTRTKGSRLLGISDSEMVATEIQFLLTIYSQSSFINHNEHNIYINYTINRNPKKKNQSNILPKLIYK